MSGSESHSERDSTNKSSLFCMSVDYKGKHLPLFYVYGSFVKKIKIADLQHRISQYIVLHFFTYFMSKICFEYIRHNYLLSKCITCDTFTMVGHSAM